LYSREYEVACRDARAYLATRPPSTEAAGQTTSVGSALELDRWMRWTGLTDRELAARLGLSRSYVSGQRSGRRRWSRTFEEKVTAVVEVWPGMPDAAEGV
jgi:hypothetical protein